MTVTEWPWWRLPLLLRAYSATPPATACAVIAVLALHADWHVLDFEKFLVFACCGVISVASTPRVAYTSGGVTRDFGSIWVLPTAILLPPIYVAVVSIPLLATLQFWVHRGVLYRRVFTAASISISYVLAATAFRLVPASFAGVHVGSGLHAFTWALTVAGCYILGGRLQYFLIVIAVKLTDPTVRVWAMQTNRDSLQSLFVEIDLAVLITLVVAVSPALGILAVPLLFLVRRFIVHPALLAQSRLDAKTGLLNVSTWEAEAESELSRSVRTRSAMSVVLIDIDHFKRVNDTYGHLVGDRVLKTIAEALTSQSRDYDRAGRFGGEEFVLLLAQTSADDACRIAERLRGYVASLKIPTDDRPDAPRVAVTISVGVTVMPRDETYELTDLLAAADSAMYVAKQEGRNKVAFAQPLHDMGLDEAWRSASDADSAHAGNGTRSGAPGLAGSPLVSSPLSSHQVVLVQSEQTAASLCLQR
jgi:diguanylate cyclase (GGDEF)-like protein